jgi:hypothetical protein
LGEASNVRLLYSDIEVQRHLAAWQHPQAQQHVGALGAGSSVEPLAQQTKQQGAAAAAKPSGFKAKCWVCHASDHLQAACPWLGQEQQQQQQSGQTAAKVGSSAFKGSAKGGFPHGKKPKYGKQEGKGGESASSSH